MLMAYSADGSASNLLGNFGNYVRRKAAKCKSFIRTLQAADITLIFFIRYITANESISKAVNGRAFRHG